MSVVSRRLLIAALLLAWAPIASAQTVDEVIEKHLTAIGGRAALAKIKSRTMTGTMTVSTPAGELSGPIEVFNEAPNLSRTLIKLDLSAVGAGEMIIDQRFNGTTGYVLNSLQGNSDMTGNQLENMRNSTFPNPFLDYKERGMTVTLGPKEQVNGRDAYVLIATPKAGSIVRQYIDAESYLPIRFTVKVEVPQMGEVEQTTDLLDHRDVDGVKVPFSLKATSSVQSFTISITKVEHNTKIDPAVFSKPSGDR